LIIAAYTKSGGSWLTWMLIDAIYKPNFLCDQVDKAVLDKIIFKTERIIRRNPDVHIIRHPLDVMCSMWNYMLLTNRATGNQETEFYNNFLQEGCSSLNTTTWKQFISWAGTENTTQIKYDALVNDTHSELQRVLPDVNISSTIEKYSVEALRERELESSKKINRVTNEKYSFFNKASSFYYKDILSNDIMDRGHKLFNKQIEEYWPNTIGNNT